MTLRKIGDAYTNNLELRDKVKDALEKGGLIVAIQSETGLVIMDELDQEDAELDS